MTKKRRNNGKDRCNRGHVKPVRCSNCSRCVAKDKAVRKLMVRNMVEIAAQKDIIENSAYEEMEIPKFYINLSYCISCAIHLRLVRGRSKEDRKNREPPQRRRMFDSKKKEEKTA
ncbi:40S ribosomal protein S26, partial [Bonamia ostreae]